MADKIYKRRRAPASAREGALQVLYAVEEEGAYANLVLDQVLREAPLAKSERALMTELAYGVLRWRLTLDRALEPLLKYPLAELTPWIRNILRLGVYQLLFLDRIPEAAVCNEANKLAHRYGHRGVAGLVNGVLRSFIRQGKKVPCPSPEEDPAENLAVRFSHPQWVVERWLKRYGWEETFALCAANNQPAGNWLRTNTLRLTREGLAALLRQQGLSVVESARVPEGLRVDNLTSWRELQDKSPGNGLNFYIQDESSMAVAHALSPLPGETVIDACAGVGGKTTHLAQLMRDQGRILAFDVHAHKLAVLSSTAAKMGISIIEEYELDARLLHERWGGQADRVLVDAPCSALGVLRRRPDVRWRREEQDIEELSRLQKEILAAAGRCVREGGVLVYTACTLEPEENEEAVEALLASQPFVYDDLNPCFPGRGWTEDDRQQMKRGFFYLFPHRHGTDGFFIARLRRF